MASTKKPASVWDSMVALAQNLRMIRMERGLSQEELAAAVGISNPRISELENGKGNPRLATIEAIAKALSVELSALFSDGKKVTKNRK